MCNRMPCEWEGKTIVVMDAVRIAPPYTSDSCSGGNPTQLSRVRKMVAPFAQYPPHSFVNYVCVAY
jgi:hypothetical protein